MKLRSLRVHGFKSFADTTEIQFHEGITAVVGPNGCGKSNISDAVRWVLGEQRPTAIRGAKMEEAIFQGSIDRRPVNRGSVTMVVSNEDGSLPVPFEEVEIGRVVYRDGGSDYSINRSACRLKDVVDLTRDTGLGANAYSVIENRMIDAILSDRAEERRALFEEASGIGKYKDRRRAAQRRLERAEQDLMRLEDVIAEIQTKVRSLARQRGKAERHLELRHRRLDVEMAVVGHQLDTLGQRLAELDRSLAGDHATGEGMVAEVREAEMRLESLRIGRLDAEKARASAAGHLDEIRTELARWERELAVAEERASYAQRRLTRIGQERGETQARGEQMAGEAETLSGDRAALGADVEAGRADLEARQEAVAGVRERLTKAREALETLEARERETLRRGAQLEGDADAAEGQAAELERRLQRLGGEMEVAATELSDLEGQGDLFSSRLETLKADEASAREEVARAARALEEASEALEVGRSAELAAADHAGALETRRQALEALEREREGMEPAVKAALKEVDGVLGTLVDFVRSPGALARPVEAYLGPLARGLVVRDRSAAEGVRRWFGSTWSGGGGVIVLPLDAAPPPGRGGSLLGTVEAVGEGAPWVRALLGDVTLVDSDDALLAGEEGPRLAASGASLDALGVMRIGDPSGAAGVLERRERLRSLTDESGLADERAREARTRREEARARQGRLEEALEDARAVLRAAEDERRSASSEAAAQVDRRARADQHRDELARQLEGTRAARARSTARARAAREDRASLHAEEEALRGQRGEVRATLEGVQEEWEVARSEESALAVAVTRLEGELARLEERIEGLAAARQADAERGEALDVEEATLRDELEQASALREEGAAATQELFRQRESAEVDLRARDEALQTSAAGVQDAERRAREARHAEREASDRRHAIELERGEIRSRLDRIQERLEGEWGRPMAALLGEAKPVEGKPEALQEELREIIVALDRIGPVNMLAVEEHAEESQRLDFLTAQRDDLVEARSDLRQAIREINQTATELFNDTFARIRENFRSVHRRLFEGGEADIWLDEGEDALEAAVEIHASPRGKKTQRIDLLSGGERALTALALLFAIYLVKPSPFCVLDEVDAPLDENNIGRFIKLLDEFKRQTQFVVITHNPRTIEAADWIYGVTMEEPGVSTIVGVRLDDALERARGTAA